MPTVKTKDGAEIFYKDWGHGPIVVFSRGWPFSVDAWIVLGLAGLANGWRLAFATWGTPRESGELIFTVAAAVWLAVTALYGWKWIAAPVLARAEVNHPVQCCFVGLGGVAAMVMAQGALPCSRPAAWLLFAAGAFLTVVYCPLLWGDHLRRDGAADGCDPHVRSLADPRLCRTGDRSIRGEQRHRRGDRGADDRPVATPADRPT